MKQSHLSRFHTTKRSNLLSQEHMPQPYDKHSYRRRHEVFF